MNKLSRVYFIVIISLFFAGHSFISPRVSYSASIDPSFKFSTIETEHFVISFHQGLDDMAAKAALISEDVHNKLTVNFRWAPSGKTQIVLLDSMDFANGMATVLPYNAIYIFAVPPMHDTVIGEYDDWLELVILHEYTHILTMDPSRGYSTWTRKIFGKTLPGYDPLSFLVFLFTAPPNVFMPDWWLEGVATWAETEFTSAGRGRSAFVEMVFRMSVLDDTVPHVDQLNGDVPYWPSGSMPYLYGMLLDRYIAETYGKDVPGDLNIAHSGRVPFFISNPPARQTGLNYAFLYRDMVSKLKADQNSKIENLKSSPLTDYRRLPVEGEILTNPRLSPNGLYLAVNRRDPHQHEEIVIVDMSTFKEFEHIRRLPSDHGMSWAPDSQKLYFTQADFNGTYNLYQDIYAYDFTKGKKSRITRHLRTKDIDVSPDGEHIAFVKVEAGRQNIAVLSLGSKDVQVLTDLYNSVLSGPRWSLDGKAIVFTQHYNSGRTSIEMFDVESGITKTLIKDEHYNINPLWSDEKTIIYSSNRTGVYNLYAYSLIEERSYQVTHVLGGAFQPEMSWEDRKIFYSGYDSKGFYIAELPYDTAGWTLEMSPAVSPSWNGSGADDTIHAAEGKDESAVNISEKDEYCPLKTAAPRFWIPTLLGDHDGAVFGAFTAGQDVLGYHTYLAQGGFGTSGEGYYDFTYIYNRWDPVFFFRGYALPGFYSEFFEDEEDYYEKESSLSAGISVPVPFVNTLESRYSIIAGYTYLKLKHLSEIENRSVDGLGVFEGNRSNIFFGFRHSSALKYPYSISREEGRNISFVFKNYHKSYGSKLRQDEYELDYQEYIQVRPGKNDVVFVDMKGAISDGDQVAQQAYQIGGSPATANKYSLRGFSTGFETGKYVMTGTLEYRFPVKYFFRGWNTKPFYLDKLHIAVFSDAGNVWGNNEGFRLGDFSAGAGVEARLDLVLGYKLKITPAIGIAQGLTDDGETQPYITIYTAL